MVRLITLTLLLALITLVSSQSVSVLNTPSGPITRGARVPVTWETTAPATQPGVLSAIAKSTQDTTVLSDKIDINSKTFEWLVDVPPDTYSLALNDGSGNKFSGPVEVIAAKAGTPAPKAAPSKAPPAAAPAPAKGPTEPKLVRRAPQNSASQPQPTQSQVAKSSSTSTKSAFDLLLSLMTVAIIMVHSA